MPPSEAVVRPEGDNPVQRFAWQVAAPDGSLLMRSPRAPESPWHAAPSAGFSDSAQWRIYGLPLGRDGRMLYAAQTREERQEARSDVALGASLAAVAVGLLGHAWLRARVRAELRPLRALSERLAAWDVDRAGAQTVLGPAERLELEPVHGAIEALAARLAARIANEQAFAAHAAHALRTPLAGIDAQLAVALRECPPPLRDRLQRVRGAAAGLQGVVAALLGLFRAGEQPQRDTVDVAAMLARLPAPLLEVHAAPGCRVDADPDLLAAALLNLLDNAQRHGASRVWVEPAPHGLRLRDDGPGIAPAQRARLQAALDAQAYEGVSGLGLTLADRVARAHGGRLTLVDADEGFAVEIALGDEGAAVVRQT
jgi:two-component system sensor histidine kinase TctE